MKTSLNVAWISEIKYKELANIIDEPVPQYSANYKITCYGIDELLNSNYGTTKRIEELLGCSVIELVEMCPNSQVLKIISLSAYFQIPAQSGQKLPDSLDKDILSYSRNWFSVI